MRSTESQLNRHLLRRTAAPLGLALCLIGLGAACGDDPPKQQAVIDPGDGGTYAPAIDPAQFTSAIDNPYLPLRPGSRWEYEAVGTDGSKEIIVVEVTDQVRTVMGVETVVVHDVVTADGEVIEDTFDWYAQDAAGNVWYFGEDSTSFDQGKSSKKGSWEAGVAGAQPGIVMVAQPSVTDHGYRQEYLRGQAEDMAQVIAVGGTATTPTGTFDEVIVTRDWTPLEPSVVEEKTYAPGVGFVGETKTGGEVVSLVEYVVG